MTKGEHGAAAAAHQHPAGHRAANRARTPDGPAGVAAEQLRGTHDQVVRARGEGGMIGLEPEAPDGSSLNSKLSNRPTASWSLVSSWLPSAFAEDFEKQIHLGRQAS